MDLNTVLRLGAAGLLGLVLFGAALALRAVVPPDPLAAELTRCRKLGLEAAGNQTCEKAWAESRARFFVSPSTSMER